MSHERHAIVKQLALGTSVDALTSADWCLVTVDENKALNKLRRRGLSGWNRYRATGIEVWDRATGHVRTPGPHA